MINVPAIDMISQEINLVGTYNNLDELLTLTAQGRLASGGNVMAAYWQRSLDPLRG